MTEISNIEAIIELILREARNRRNFGRVTTINLIRQEINRELNQIIETYDQEERRKDNNKINKRYFSLQHKEAEERRKKEDEDKN